MRARLTLFVPRLGWAALLASCALVPTVFTRLTNEAFMVPKVTLLWLCLLLASFGVGIWCLAIRQAPFPRLAITWPLVALLAWTILATVTSTSVGISVLGTYGRYDGFLGLIAGIAIVAAVVTFTWRRPDRLTWVVVAMLVGGVADAGYITIHQFGLDWINWYNASLQPIERPYGLLGNSNFSGAHLAILVQLVLVLTRRVDRPALRWALWILAGWFGLAVWWTGTRGGLLALVGGVAVAGAIAPELLPRLVRWSAGALAVVALTLVLTASVTGGNALPGVGGSAPRFLQGSSLADRQEIWSAGVHMIGDHPLVGVGPDAFGLKYAYYRVPRYLDLDPQNADEAHDIFIERAATSGLPALAAYLWLLAVVIRLVVRARRDRDSPHRWLLAGMGGALGAYLLQGLVSIDVVPLSQLGWLSLAGIVVVTDPALAARRSDRKQAEPVQQTVPLAAVTAGAVAVAVVAAFAVRPFVADLHYRRGVVASASGNGARAAAEFAAAVDWHGREPRYHARLADQLVAIERTEVRSDELRVQLLEEAVTGYRQALALAPGDQIVLRTEARAEVLLAAADPTRADAHFAAAEALFRPLSSRIKRDRRLHMEFGGTLALHADVAPPHRAQQLRERAAAEYRTAARLNPNDSAPWSGLGQLAQAEHRYRDARRLFERAHRLDPSDRRIQAAIDQVDEKLAGGAD
jgi:O-antigen ligase